MDLKQAMEDLKPTSTLSLASDPEPPETIIQQEIEDDRIVCTNSQGLDRILKIAVDHVTELAESQNLSDHRKAQFVSRFTEIFMNNMQENLTVNGLPWIVNRENLSETQEKQQKSEINDALLSKVSKAVEIVTRKRKAVPLECRRIYGEKLKHERRNLMKSKISHNVTLPSISSLPSTSTCLNLVTDDAYMEVSNSLELVQEQIQANLDRLEEIQKNADIAEDIIQRNKPSLSDTGYTSE